MASDPCDHCGRPCPCNKTFFIISARCDAVRREPFATPPLPTPTPSDCHGRGRCYSWRHYVLINALPSLQRSNYNLFDDAARCKTGAAKGGKGATGGLEGKEGNRGGRNLQCETRSPRGEIFKVSRNEVGGNTSRADIVEKKKLQKKKKKKHQCDYWRDTGRLLPLFLLPSPHPTLPVPVLSVFQSVGAAPSPPAAVHINQSRSGHSDTPWV